MKKHLSKVVIATIVLVAIASTMIFAGLVNKVAPQSENVVRYTIIEDAEVVGVVLNDRKAEVDLEQIEEELEEELIAENTLEVANMTREVFLFGDANKDGKFSITDAVVTLNDVVAKKELTSAEATVRNVANSNDKVTVTDAVRLLQFSVGSLESMLEVAIAEDEVEVVSIATTYSEENTTIEVDYNVKSVVIEKLFENHVFEVRNSDNELVAEVEALGVDEDFEVITYSDDVLDLEKGNYTFVVVDEEGEDVLSVEFFVNKVEVSDVVVYDSTDDEHEEIVKIDKEHQLLDVEATVEGTHTGTFTLTLISKEEQEVDNGTEWVEIDRLVVNGGKVVDGTVVFEEVDVTELEDGEITVEVKYVEGGYYSVAEASTTYTKATKLVEVVSSVVTRVDVATVQDEMGTTTVTLKLDLENVDDVTEVAALVKGAEEENKAPEFDEDEDTLQEVEEANFVNVVDNKWELSYVVEDTDAEDDLFDQLNAEAEDYEKLPAVMFVQFTNAAGITEVLEFAIPANLPEVRSVESAILSEEAVLTWAEPLVKDGVEGYEIAVYNNVTLKGIQTVEVGTNELDLLETIKEYAEEGVFVATVRALANNTTHLDQIEATVAEGEVTIAKYEEPLPEVDFEEKNTGKVTIKFEGATKEELEEKVEELENVKEIKLDLQKVGEEEPEEIVIDEMSEIGEGVYNDEETTVTYIVDLTDYMTEVGEYYLVGYTIVVNEDSLYLDADKEEIESENNYVNDSIKEVKITTDKDSLYLEVETEGNVASEVKVSYKAEGIDEIVTTVDSYNVAIEGVEINKEYTVVVTLLYDDVELDEVTEKITVDGSYILTSEDVLTKGDNFIVERNENKEITSITVDTETVTKDFDRITNLDVLLAIDEMLVDGEEFALDNDGLLEYVDFSIIEEDETEKTITLNKKHVSEILYVEAYYGKPVTLVLEGTANKIAVEAALTDIANFKADEIFAYGRFRLSGDFNFFDVSEEDYYDREFITSYNATGNFTINDGTQIFYAPEYGVYVEYNAEADVVEFWD